MKKQEFLKIHGDISAAFPGMISDSPVSLGAWFKVVEGFEFDAISKAAHILITETETIRPGSNLGAMLRNRAKPVMTTATIEGHLQHALLLFRTPDGQPYEYLQGISPRLKMMAESNDLFSRDLSTDVQGIRVHKIAAQFIEEIENHKLGFHQPKTIPPERQLAGPLPKITEEERLANLAKLAELRKKFGWSEDLEPAQNQATVTGGGKHAIT